MLSRDELTRPIESANGGWLCVSPEGYAEMAESHFEALDRLADLEATLDRADVHTAGMLEKFEAMEKENGALKAQLMAYAALVRQMVTLCDAPDNTLALDAVKHCKLERTTLKARLADAERKAVERERKAWDAAMAETWQMLRLQYPGATMDGSHVPLSLRKWAERMDAERDRRYPLPKEEGR